MSLISDALKKARQEAARQDAAQRGLPYAVGGAESTGRRSLVGPLVAGLAAGGVLVGALALAAYLGHWGPWHHGEEERLAAAAPALPAEGAGSSASPGTAPAAPPAGAGASAPVSLPVPLDAAPIPLAPNPEAPASPAGGLAREAPTSSPAPARSAPPTLAARPSAAERQPVPIPPAAPPARSTAENSAPPAQAAPPPAARSTPPPASPPAAAEGSEEKVYSGELPVPGGGTLRLSGIAFSENPVAVIDGKIVSAGEVVQGFTVVEIQRGRVRLQGHGMSVVVAVR